MRIDISVPEVVEVFEEIQSQPQKILRWSDWWSGKWWSVI